MWVRFSPGINCPELTSEVLNRMSNVDPTPIYQFIPPFASGPLSDARGAAEPRVFPAANPSWVKLTKQTGTGQAAR